MSLSITDTQHKNYLHFAECHCAECRVLLIVVLSAVLVSVIMLNVVMLSVVDPIQQLIKNSFMVIGQNKSRRKLAPFISDEYTSFL
jgi:hypothetical protein